MCGYRYPPSGYVARMGNASSADELGEMFLDMWEEGWVDPQTR